MKTETFEWNGYTATVIIPDNPNGKWLWKTEFFYEFDKAERDLLGQGYTRVYYQISNMYGSNRAVRLMRSFQKELLKRYPLNEKAILIGFSRGGLYAFNYALFYPECVEKIYLDAPVLDLTNENAWPHTSAFDSVQFLKEHGICKACVKTFPESPVCHLPEFFSHDIPLLLICGDKDMSVPYEKNAKVLLDYCKTNGISVTYHVKKNAGHHPHSLEEDTTFILNFINE